MAVKNKKKKKDEKLAKRSWLDAYGSMSEGLGEVADAYVDPDNELQVGLAALRKSGLVGMLAEHLQNRRDAKAAAQWTDENPIGDQTPDRAKEQAALKKEATSLDMDPDKPFVSEWNTDMGIKDTAKVIPGSGTELAANSKVLPQSNAAVVDKTFAQGVNTANYTGNTNLIGKLPDISPKINPQLTAATTKIPTAGATASAGLSGAQMAGAGLAIASLAASALGSKGKTYTPTPQPQNQMRQGQKGEDIVMPGEAPVFRQRSIDPNERRRPLYNPYA